LRRAEFRLAEHNHPVTDDSSMSAVAVDRVPAYSMTTTAFLDDIVCTVLYKVFTSDKYTKSLMNFCQFEGVD
jgi:hypothetical protein